MKKRAARRPERRKKGEECFPAERDDKARGKSN